MKVIFVILPFLFASILSFGQEEKEYRLDDFFQITAKKNYSYKRIIKKEDSLWSSSVFDRKGKLVEIAHYKDEPLKYLHGYYAFYKERKKHYEGNYINNKPIGTWYFYEPYGILSDSLDYEFYKNPAFIPITKSGINLRQNITGIKSDSFLNKKTDTAGAFQRVEKEAMFPGGLPGWKKYLEKNLLPKNGIPNQIYRDVKVGTVQVRFVVCTDGTICNVETINSVHPLVDWYAVRTIRHGPGWEAGEQNNRKVKSYHTQPITFYFEIE